MKPEVIDKLRGLGLKTSQIAWVFLVSERTIQRWGKPVPTAKGRRGRPPVLDETHAQQILDVLNEASPQKAQKVAAFMSQLREKQGRGSVVMSLDEASFNTKCVPRYGWSPMGERVQCPRDLVGATKSPAATFSHVFDPGAAAFQKLLEAPAGSNASAP